MQDVAPSDYTTVIKEFLLDKFQNRVIIRGTANNWPHHSPNLNPLDFHSLGEAQIEACRNHAEIVEELINCVKSFAGSYYAETIRRTTTKVIERPRLFLNADGVTHWLPKISRFFVYFSH